MNTKYPINGRVTTLNDLVHEYGASSSWPKDNKKYDLIDNPETIVSQPFQNLVFKDALDANNKFVGERPYEIVYFDNVYSNTERDSTGKHMKIIQKSDSSVFTDNYPGGISGHEYIKAGDVADPGKIISGKYGFKFIVASQNDKKQYYYNYRTSTGEATVMYALRNIIKILKKSNKNLLTCIQQLFIPKIDKDGNKTYPEIDNIINKNNNELKSEAYKYLGDFIWTYKNIQIKNYTTAEQSILNIASTKGYLKLDTNTRSSINDVLNAWVGNNTDNNYSYNQESQYNQLKYYLNIFANSQRFFVSYVTGFRFGKISNKSYLQIEPVLRCDLGAFVLYNSVVILSSIHDYRTALPQNEISEDTQLDIILKYKVTYENISKESTPITTTISLTWHDIIYNSNKDKFKDNPENIWFSLRNAVCENKDIYEADNEDGYKEYMDDKETFGKHAYKDESGYFPDINKTSLKTLNWPINESLLLTDETEFKNIINNPLYTNENKIKNYASTADPSTFNTNDLNKIKEIINIKGHYAPFGTLRMHNFLDKENGKSGYHCDIDLLRCKNFYIVQQNSEISNISINIYYSIPYDTIIPNTCVRLISKSFKDAGISDDNKADKDKPNSIIKWQQEVLGSNIIYSIPNNSDNEVFITISSSSTKMKLYASGETEPLTSTKKDSYINNLNLELYYLDSTETWQLAEKDVDYIINAYTRSNTLPYYSFKFKNSMKKGLFWKFKFNDIKQFLYFRSNDIQKNDKQQLTIIPLHVQDENSATIEQKVKGLNNIDISLQYLIYHENTNADSYINDTTCLNCFTQAFTKQSSNWNQNAYVNKNQSFYIEPISFKTSDSYQYQEFNTTVHNPFNVAYKTAKIINDKNIYKFVQCSTLFGKEINNRRVSIEEISDETQPSIYLAFEPIYIIEFGKIQFSTEIDEIDRKPLVESSCKERYGTDNTISLNQFKYKINTGANTESINLQDKVNNLNILSLYTSIIFVDCDFLKINNKSIDKDLQQVTSSNQTSTGFLISYNIVVSSFNSTNNTYEEITDEKGNKAGTVSISNGLTQSQINERFSKIKFKPNKQYLVDIVFTYFRQRTKEIACSFSHSNSLYNGYVTLTITKNPVGYVGTLKEGTVYSGSSRPISLPIGCKITLQNNFKIPDKYKDKMDWLGWAYTYNPGKYEKGNGDNNTLTIDIDNTYTDISIIGYLYIDQSISTKPDATTPSTPTTPDTSSNKP